MEKSISGRAFAHVLPDMILFVGFYLGGNEVDKFVDVIGCDDAFFCSIILIRARRSSPVVGVRSAATTAPTAAPARNVASPFIVTSLL